MSTQLWYGLYYYNTQCTFSLSFYHLLCPGSLLERSAKRVQPKCSQKTQANGQRLAGLDRAGNRATSKDERSKESEFDTIGVAILDA